MQPGRRLARTVGHAVARGRCSNAPPQPTPTPGLLTPAPGLPAGCSCSAGMCTCGSSWQSSRWTKARRRRFSSSKPSRLWARLSRTRSKCCICSSVHTSTSVMAAWVGCTLPSCCSLRHVPASGCDEPCSLHCDCCCPPPPTPVPPSICPPCRSHQRGPECRWQVDCCRYCRSARRHPEHADSVPIRADVCGSRCRHWQAGGFAAGCVALAASEWGAGVAVLSPRTHTPGAHPQTAATTW